jgi:hypothetical protein
MAASLTNAEKIAMLMRSDKYTTGQVALLAGVAPRTAAQWCDSGILDSYRIPRGGKTAGQHPGDRRVTRESLTRFFEERGMPPLPDVNPCIALFTNRKLLLDWPGHLNMIQMADGWDALIDYGRVYERHTQLYAAVVDLGYCPGQNASAILNYRPEEGRHKPHVIIVLREDDGTEDAARIWENRGAFTVMRADQAWELLPTAVIQALREQTQRRIHTPYHLNGVAS